MNGNEATLEKVECFGRTVRGGDAGESGTDEGDLLMFKEVHYMDHNFRAMELAEKLAERRRQSLAASSAPSGRYRMARSIFALAVPAGGRQAEGRA
jgi:hypothetical protein